jgi:hypothetical protein
MEYKDDHRIIYVQFYTSVSGLKGLHCTSPCHTLPRSSSTARTRGFAQFTYPLSLWDTYADMGDVYACVRAHTNM